MIEVKKVKTRSELKKFIGFPVKLYSGNAYWVSPLLMDEMNTLRQDKNPAFEYCEAEYWLAYKDGRIAGRIAGIINRRYIEKWGLKNARFGWLDFIDDFEVCKALLETVETWAIKKGMTGIQGPMGFCDLDREGMLIEGFDKIGKIITIYNHPYYMEYLEKLGYLKDVDWVEYEIKVPRQIPEKLVKIAEQAMKNLELKIVQAKKPKDFLPYAEELFEVLNESYKDLYGVVPLNKKQITVYTKQYLNYTKPEYTRILLDRNGKVAAFGIIIPSLSEAVNKSKGRLFPLGFIRILKALNKSESLDMYLIGVRPDLQSKGVPAVIITEIARTIINKQYKVTETAPMLEYNQNVRTLWKYFETDIQKRRRCYVKQLG